MAVGRHIFYLTGAPVSLFNPMVKKLLFSIELINEFILGRWMLTAFHPSLLRNIPADEVLRSLASYKFPDWSLKHYSETLSNTNNMVYFKQERSQWQWNGVVFALPAIFTCLASPKTIENKKISEWQVEKILDAHLVVMLDKFSLPYLRAPFIGDEIITGISNAKEGFNVSHHENYTIYTYKYNFHLDINHSRIPLNLPPCHAQNCEMFNHLPTVKKLNTAAVALAARIIGQGWRSRSTPTFFKRLPKEVALHIASYVVDAEGRKDISADEVAEIHFNKP